jgi:hypothetical protein
LKLIFSLSIHLLIFFLNALFGHSCGCFNLQTAFVSKDSNSRACCLLGQLLFHMLSLNIVNFSRNTTSRVRFQIRLYFNPHAELSTHGVSYIALEERQQFTADRDLACFVPERYLLSTGRRFLTSCHLNNCMSIYHFNTGPYHDKGDLMTITQ